MTAEEYLKDKGITFNSPSINIGVNALYQWMNEYAETYHKERLEEQWISVEDRLPEIGGISYICSHNHESSNVYWFCNGKWRDGFNEVEELVTHWMPWPEFPNKP